MVRFVAVPPKVIEAAKRLTALMDVAESDDRLILNWIAQAVAEGSNEAKIPDAQFRKVTWEVQ